MKLIPLTRGLFTKVDDEDFEELSKFSWCALMANGNIYAARRDANTDKQVLLHRVILNAVKGSFVDHKDGDPMNNVRLNLRICSRSENNRNRIKRKPGRSIYKGCVPRQMVNSLKWRAVVIANKKLFGLGTFSTEIEAARAYDAAAKIHHGEFARLNFPNS